MHTVENPGEGDLKIFGGSMLFQKIDRGVPYVGFYFYCIFINNFLFA
jgi:hypothetical protein